MDARFDRHSRGESRIQVWALRILLFHFSSLKTAHAALFFTEGSSSKREKA
jgi:hypothetical protein